MAIKPFQAAPIKEPMNGTSLAWISWLQSVWMLLKYLYVGAGSPAGVVTAPPGSIYLNTSGGAGTTLFVKESGTGTSGWVGK